ncbi:MAG: efflux RND transporter periplasmic adaptor subunit [Prolixibacteraceae bacterium]|nr:efflux RND transporter periplasmic adaptor subunit [Prolixibacteraceae bacterium]
MKIIKLAIPVFLIAITACSTQNSDTQVNVASPVSVTDIKYGSIEKIISTTGTVSAVKEVSLSTNIEGDYVLKTNSRTGHLFMFGDQVSENQVIIAIEDAAYLNGIGLESKKLNLDISNQEYKQQQSLFEKGGVTQSDLSVAEVSKVNAKNSYELAQINLSNMSVKAPFKGVITNLPYHTQNTRVSSGTSVVTLMDYSKLLLEVSLPEKYINDLKKNMKIRAMNYTMPDDTLSGFVTEISPAVSSSTRTFTVKLKIDNDAMKLRPGMFVRTEIILDHKDSVIVVPKEVITSSQRGKNVFVVVKGTAEDRHVTIGYQNNDEVEITSGLKINDQLIIKGYETLRNRSKVKVIK